MTKRNIAGIAGALVLLIGLVVLSIRNKPVDSEPFFSFDDTEAEEEFISYIYVDIKGAVVLPGVYKVETGARLFQVVDLAGGLISTADRNAVNLSIILADQDVIYVPTLEEAYPNVTEHSDEEIGGVININTADLSSLQELQGIGPATAQAIIDYRSENGPFESKEDIMNVSGIGENTFETIEDFITT